MYNILGIMSGSSLDGIDLASCSFKNENSYVIHHATTYPLPDIIAEKFNSFSSLNPFDIASLEADFSLFVAEKILEFTKEDERQLDLIVSHGHTIFHHPEGQVSWQLGNGGIIASRCGIDTLCDLRIQDIAFGGQGAPLASLMDKYILNDYDVLLNLGGIANVSFRSEDKGIVAWDIGPCNQIFNTLARKLGKEYDDKGILARQGNILGHLISDWQRLDYFNLDAPKSLDNSWVKTNFISPLLELPHDPVDLLATSVEFLAIQMANDFEKYQIENKVVLATGGGAYNTFLVERFNHQLASKRVVVKPADPELIDYKEAVLMAFMGYLYLEDKPNTIASATGALKSIVAGALYRGNG